MKSIWPLILTSYGDGSCLVRVWGSLFDSVLIVPVGSGWGLGADDSARPGFATAPIVLEFAKFYESLESISK